MLPATFISLLAISSVVSAAPIEDRGLLSNIFGNGKSTVDSILKSLGITVSSDASKHGSKWSLNLSKPTAKANATLKSHSVNWGNKFQGWSTYKANGVNLGSWLEVEQSNTPGVIPDEYTDEWSWCQAVGFSVCGPVLEKHYSGLYSTADIDRFAAYGINTLRIPTTYAAWLSVPGSYLYHGNQQIYLRNIINYAQGKGMHIVLGLHSLPGGVNWLDIGEHFGNIGWWYNQTNFDYSLKVIDNVLAFIQTSNSPNQITLAPINEPCDNFANFATPNTVSYPDGVNYLNTYYRAVYAKIQKVNKNIPLMISDAFMGASYWAPFYTNNGYNNIAIDSHFYFFAASGVYSEYIAPITCGQASSAATTLPVFVGEFSLQSTYNNTFAGRQVIYQSQLYAYQKYLSGGAFWNGKMYSTAAVDGEGVQEDYWSFDGLISAGVILPGGAINGSYC